MNQAGSRNMTSKSFFNVLSSVASFGSSLLVNFFLSPFLVVTLGAGTFGVWRICQRLLVYVTVADGRPTQALKWTIANQQLHDDIPAKQRQVGCALVVWLRFLPLMLVFGGFLTWFAPSLIHELPPGQIPVIRMAFAVLLLNLILLPLQAIPEAVMIGMNLAYRMLWVKIFGVVLGGVCMALAAFFHYGLVGLASAVLFTSLINGVLIFALARRSLPWLGISKPSSLEVKNFFNFSLWIFVWSFIQKTMLSSDVVILGMIAAPERVAAFVLSFYLVQVAIKLIGLFMSAAMPGLGAIVGQKDLARATRVRQEILSMTLVAAAFFGGMALLWNRSFVSLWVGSEYFIGGNANLLAVILMTQLTQINSDAQVIDVTLKVKTKVLLGGLSTGLSLVLAFVFGRYLFHDIVGVLAGLIVGRLILSLSYPVLVNKALGGKAFSFYPGLLRNGGFIVLIYGVCYIFGTQWMARGWFTLVGGVFASMILLVLLTFFVGLTHLQREQFRQRLRQLPLPPVMRSL